jgi:hypothetical protein
MFQVFIKVKALVKPLFLIQDTEIVVINEMGHDFFIAATILVFRRRERTASGYFYSLNASNA